MIMTILFLSDYDKISDIPNVQFYTYINNVCALFGSVLYIPLWFYEHAEKDSIVSVDTQDKEKILKSYYSKAWMFPKSFNRYILALSGMTLLEIVTLATLGLNIYLNFCSS